MTWCVITMARPGVVSVKVSVIKSSERKKKLKGDCRPHHDSVQLNDRSFSYVISTSLAQEEENEHGNRGEGEIHLFSFSLLFFFTPFSICGLEIGIGASKNCTTT